MRTEISKVISSQRASFKRWVDFKALPILGRVRLWLSNFLQKPDRDRPAHYAFLAIASLIAGTVVFAPLLFTSEYFLGSNTDLPTAAFPNRDYINLCLQTKTLALWNPYAGNGIPVQTVLSSAYNPGALLGYFFDTGVDIKLNLWLHTSLACFAMAGLLLSYRVSPLSALVGGISVGFGGFMIGHTYAGHIDVVTTAGWAPLALWTICLAMRRSGIFWSLLAAISCSLMISNGHFQSAYMALWTSFLFTGLVATLGSGTAYPRFSIFDPFNKEETLRCDGLVFYRLGWRSRIDDLLGFLYKSSVILASIGALTFFLTYPGSESVAYTNRGASDLDFLLELNPPAWTWLTAAVPGIFDFSNILAGWVPWLSWEGQFFMGTLTLWFVPFALLSLPSSKTLPQVIVGVLAILLILGGSTPFYAFYIKLDPGAHQFRVPARFHLALTLMVAWLTALGVDRAVDIIRQKSHKLLLGCFAGVLLLYLVPWLMFYYGSNTNAWWADFLTAMLGKGHYDDLLAPTAPESPRVIFAQTWLRLTGSVTLLMCGGYAVFRFPARLAQGLILILTLADFTLFAKPYLFTTDEHAFYPPKGILKFFKENLHNQLFFQRLECDLEMHQINRFARYHLPDVETYQGFAPAVYQKVIQWVAQFRPDSPVMSFELFHKGRLFDIDGAQYYFSKSNPEELGKRDPGMMDLKHLTVIDDIHVYENLQAEPRAFMVHQVDLPKGAARLFNEMQDDPLIPRTRVLLDPQTYKDFTSKYQLVPLSSNDDIAQVTGLEPNQMDVYATSPFGGLVVTTDLWWPGWVVRVDGREEPLWPVHEGLHRGVVVGPGPHRIVFSYEPARFFTGVKVSLGYLLFCLLLPVLLWLVGNGRKLLSLRERKIEQKPNRRQIRRETRSATAKVGEE